MKGASSAFVVSFETELMLSDSAIGRAVSPTEPATFGSPLQLYRMA